MIGNFWNCSIGYGYAGKLVAPIERKGKVTITFALALIPTIFSIGMGLDFSGAIQRRAKLNVAVSDDAIAARRRC